MIGNEPICICGKQMKAKRGTSGWFYGCVDYPTCDHTEAMDDDEDDGDL